MRISLHTQEVIRDTVREVFGPDARVSLFGSRLDDGARGGDIDLFIEVDRPVEELRRKSLRLVARLQRLLGDQTIDVIVLDPETTPQPVHEQARRTGVRL